MDIWYKSPSDGEGIVRPNRFWNLVELVATLVQIVAAIVVLSLTVAKDEHPKTPLLIWVIGYTCACIATVPILSWRFHTYINQLEEPFGSTPYTALAADEENNIQVAGDENSGKRSHRVMDFFKMALEFFFAGWFMGYVSFFFDDPYPDRGSLLYGLSMGFLAFSCIRYGGYILLCVLLPFCICWLSFIRVVILIIEAIEAFYAHVRFNDVGSDWECEGDDISCCCICLGKYGDKDEQIRKLTCLHVFHSDCIDMWAERTLKFKRQQFQRLLSESASQQSDILSLWKHNRSPKYITDWKRRKDQGEPVPQLIQNFLNEPRHKILKFQ